MECKDILNLIAIVVIPIVAVLIGQYLLSTITAWTTVSATSTVSSITKSSTFPSLSVNPSNESRLWFVSSFFR